MEVEATVEKYKASLSFATKKAHTMEAFRGSKEFFDACVKFSQGAFEKGYKLGRFECQAQFAKRHQGLDLSLNEGGNLRGNTPLR